MPFRILLTDDGRRTQGNGIMKVIELQPRSPTIDDLLEAVNNDDVLLVRDGQPLARLEKFDQEDWQDWQYESSAAALERGRHGREQYARGECKSLEQVKEELSVKTDSTS